MHDAQKIVNDHGEHGEEIDQKSDFSILYQSATSPKSSLCVFASFNFTDKVEAYVLRYVSDLALLGFDIAFVSTSKLPQISVGELQPLCALIAERENKGLDFGSWKLGLELCNWAAAYTEVLLVNDSVFGPFHDLQPVISTMNRQFDIWGMTDSHEVDYHIQSYFLHFNEPVIRSTTWLQFWQNMSFKSLSKLELIKKYEVGLSQTFLQAGFMIGAYASVETINRSVGCAERNISPSIVHWKSLIEKFNFPFLKRELLIKPAINRTYWNKNIYVNTSNWHLSIEKHTPYPTRLIDDYLDVYFQHAVAADPQICLRQKKILFVLEHANASDAQCVLLTFLQWLAKNKNIPVEVVICNASPNNDLYDEFADLAMVTRFWALTANEKNELRDRLVTDSIGLIVSNALANWELQNFLTFLQAPQVVCVDSIPDNRQQTPVLDDHIESLRLTTHYVASTETIKQTIAQQLSLSDVKISTVFKFTDTESSDAKHEKAPFQTPATPIASDAFLVGIDGAANGERSTDLIVSLAAMLCRREANIHLLWSGIDAKSDWFQRLKSDLIKAGISDQVHLVLTAPVRPIRYRSPDVYLSVANDDSLPLRTIQAGLKGIPVICFENSVTASDYVPLGLGRAVAYLDIAAMRDAVLDYYANRAQLAISSAIIANIVRANFTTEWQAPKLFSVLNTFYCEAESVPVDEHPEITIMVHLFYDNTWKDLKHRLIHFKDLNTNFLFSVSEACLVKDELVNDIRQTFRKAHVLTTSNIGKDIGGKFALIDLYLSLGLHSEYILFLHDKQSPHSLDGETWKNNLMKIIDYKNYKHILATFNADKTIGIVGAREHLVNEFNPLTGMFINNNDRTHAFLKKYAISITNYEFIGGTMYWMKAAVVEQFFKKYNPMHLRAELEAGNVMDNYGSTNAHTWERILSWSATNEGYRVCGI